MMSRVAGIVVIYNPEDDIIHNIESYIQQVDQLYLIDNSERENLNIKNYSKEANCAEYIFNGKNLGISKSLNLGAILAIKSGCDYILTMDQDTEATSNLVKKLIEIHRNYKSVGIAAPYPLNRIHKILPRDNSIHQVNNVITSGALLSLRAYEKAGPFMEKLFIDYVDFEYCMRLKKKSYNVYQCNNAIIYHSVGNLVKWKLFGLNFYSTNHSPLRLYYRTRNRFYLRKLYLNDFKAFFKKDFKQLLKETLKIILVEHKKIEKLKMIIRGYWDYHKGVFGNYRK